MGLSLSRSLVSHSRRGLPARTLTTPPLRRSLTAPPVSSLLLSSSRRLFTTKSTPFPLLFIPLPNNLGVPVSSTAEMALYSATDTEDVLYLRVNMPGVTRDGVEVCFEPPQELTVKGHRLPDPDFADLGVEYEWKFVVPTEFFHTDQMEHIMKDGMLLVSIRKKVRGDVVCSHQSFNINNTA
ncbi:hypothetical protein Vadar_022828 [Vaccinium darrowii]|uniref:Uncharacterized protein n=1 Tax=Vaccinium darrowii TaxID=229202 RepID=A0ACB7Y1W5_9ERIC|nr:hypothetical protein Vadar_022828 [Vaccinium darrowii]